MKDQSLKRVEAGHKWRAALREHALRLFQSHLLKLDTAGIEAAEGLVPDEKLWLEEIFFSRAFQEGLDHSQVTGSAALRVEDFVSRKKAALFLGYLEWIRARHVPEIKRLAEVASSLEDAPKIESHIQAELEICRHLALIVGRLRAVAGREQPQIYPPEPFILAEMLPCPLSLLNEKQAEVRRDWVGETGTGDCWGRSHGLTLKGPARLGRTMGGKVDADLTPDKCGRGFAANLQLRTRLAMMTASELAEEFINASPTVCRRVAGDAGDESAEPWSNKTRQQFRSAARLFTKFRSVNPFIQATHAEFVTFYNLLLMMPVNHHTKIADDALTLEELIERAAGDTNGPPAPRLSPSTARRHLNYLRLLRAWLGTAFHMPIIHWDQLICWNGRERIVSDRLTTEQVAKIFHLPVWRGTRHYRGTPVSGPDVWHSAAYWVPLLQWYTGIARDALCACELEDVQIVDGIQCLIVRVGQGGVSADRGFERAVPVHSELLRLGFVEYADALRREGETLLFPDLRRASGQLAADVFSSRYWRPIRAALPGLPDDTGVGAIRLAAEQALIDLEVPEEKRRDLLGIRGPSEIDLRYSRVTPPTHLLRVVEQIPNITGHIKSNPIKLLPSRARKETAARIVPRVHERLKQEQALGRLVANDASGPALHKIEDDQPKGGRKSGRDC